jgi:hypothetical protein
MTANPFVIHERRSTSIEMTRCLHGMLTFVAWTALLISNVALADFYSDLPDKDKAYVNRVCAPIQFQQGTTAYRNCVNQYSEALLESNRTPVASLDFDEQFSVQQACHKRGAIGSTDYRECVVIEASSLEGILTADISSLSPEEIYAARQNCADDEGGVKAYRQCVNAAVTKLKRPAIAIVEPPVVAVIEQENEKIANESTANDLVSDARSIPAVNINGAEQQYTARPIPAATLATPVALRISAARTENREENTASVEITQAPLDTTHSLVTLPLLVAAEPANTKPQDANPDSQEAADTDNLDPSTSDKPSLEVAKRFAQKLWTQLVASLQGVTGINRIILLAALALPFLLIGLWLLMRRSSDESEPYAQTQSRTLKDQARVRTTHSMDDDASNDELSSRQVHFADQIEELFTDDDDPVFADDEAPEFTDESPYLPEAQTVEEAARPIPSKTKLSAILENHEREDQLGLVIEFMIYWMAFTDERYEPELKRKIFSEKVPDDHNLVKRCVLSQDFSAFANATSWLQKNAAIDEREQVLKLLMALLVYEEGITPVQNTMLRFLSNAFGFTHNQLDQLFQTAFGHVLPSMPRPDKPTWWSKQSPDKLKRWDARSVAQQSQSIQARVRLGLPLSGELNPQQIIERHERAISRCQVENFDLLTIREQQLAEKQQAKYNDAAEVLMEVSE